MPFTSRPASRVEYCLARVTASSITTLGGISPDVELVDRDPQDVPLDRAEPVGRPARLRGRLGDPAVELRGVADDRGRHRLRVLVDLALVERARARAR